MGSECQVEISKTSIQQRKAKLEAGSKHRSTHWIRRKAKSGTKWKRGKKSRSAAQEMRQGSGEGGEG